MTPQEPPGYAMGDESVQQAPITMEEFDQLKQTVSFTSADEQALQTAGEVLADQAEAFVEELFEYAAQHDFLLYYFTDGAGQPNEEYIQRVFARVVQWVHDACDTPYDQAWLDYQFEIGRRKHRTAKTQTDAVEAAPHLHLRYVLAFLYPVTTLVRPYLERADHTEDEIERMYDAWFKSMLLQVTLRSYPYVTDDDW